MKEARSLEGTKMAMEGNKKKSRWQRLLERKGAELLTSEVLRIQTVCVCLCVCMGYHLASKGNLNLTTRRRCEG
jgi:hypothetical protein